LLIENTPTAATSSISATSTASSTPISKAAAEVPAKGAAAATAAAVTSVDDEDKGTEGDRQLAGIPLPCVFRCVHTLAKINILTQTHIHRHTHTRTHTHTQRPLICLQVVWMWMP
jgi:hypothetical protein